MYEGQFKNGKPSGFGRLISNNSLFVGHLNSFNTTLAGYGNYIYKSVEYENYYGYYSEN